MTQTETNGPTNDSKDASVQPAAVKEQPNDATPTENGGGGQRSSSVLLLTFAIIVIGLGWFLLWYFYLSYYESTDDAYVNGNLINVTPVISGPVVAFFADDTDLVRKGQVLVLLDETEHRVRFEKELASLAAVALQVRQLYDNVRANSVTVNSKRVSLSKARYDYENRKQLVGSLSVSQEDFTHARDALSLAELDLKFAEEQLQIAKDLAGNTKVENHPQIEAQKGAVREAFYSLKHCVIHAPATGYVAKRTAEVGQWASPTSPLMAIIPTDYMWVDANYKETQLSNMRIGQPATVTFDIYGGSVKFEGKVLGIASGSGSVFSLIPPQNATGNWIKIVQRLPVRISIDPEKVKDYPLRLGLSANVDVDISDTNHPMLAQVPRTQAIATTYVFRLDFTELEKEMDAILQNVLKESKKDDDRT